MTATGRWSKACVRACYPCSSLASTISSGPTGTLQHFTAELADLSACDVVYIAPDIPTDDEGRSDIAVLQRLIDAVVPHLKAEAVMVVLSQVEPGFTRALALPALPRRYYQVETLVFGRAVERTMEPERYILGCADPDAPLPHHFEAVLKAFGCPILPMRYESAELAKISINFCLVSSISVANTLAEVCEAIGADWSEIVPALKLDRRIGAYSTWRPASASPAATSSAILPRFNGSEPLTARTRTSSLRGNRTAGIAVTGQPERSVACSSTNGRIPSSRSGASPTRKHHSVKNSPSLATIGQLPSDTRLRLHDPVVAASAAGRTEAVACTSALDALEGAEALLILTPWPDYRDIAAAEIAARLGGGRLVLDPYARSRPQGGRRRRPKPRYARPPRQVGPLRTLFMLTHHRTSSTLPERTVVLGATRLRRQGAPEAARRRRCVSRRHRAQRRRPHVGTMPAAALLLS